MSTLGLALAALASATLALPAAAVPIPWKNCGTSGDPLVITKADANVWPPPVPAPAEVTATFDANGHLVNLRVFLIHGIAWTLDSGELPSSTSGGFVTIPASFPMTVSSPPFPIPAGPFDTTYVFGDGGPTPVTVNDQGNLALDLPAPVNVTAGLSTNGSPGFPLMPGAGMAYALHVDMIRGSGARVFCMDVTIPMVNATALVDVVTIPAIPMVSPAGMLILGGLLLAAGMLVYRGHR